MSRFAIAISAKANELIKRAAINSRIDLEKFTKEIYAIATEFVHKFGEVARQTYRHKKKEFGTEIRNNSPAPREPLMSILEMPISDIDILKKFPIEFLFESIRYEADVTEVAPDEFYVLLKNNSLAARFGMELVVKKDDSGFLRSASTPSGPPTIFNDTISKEIIHHLEKIPVGIRN